MRHNFSLYLNGELDKERIKLLEDHLLDCGKCRTKLARLRNGHRLAHELPRFSPQRDPWNAIEAAISEHPHPLPTSRLKINWGALVTKPGFVFGAIGLIAIIAVLLVASYRLEIREEHAGTLIADALDLSEFHTVNISDIDRNNKPHVMAEGYVAELRVNDEDGDLSFKLVEDLKNPGPFIVCEIIDPIKLAPPRVGSKVRVYGISRYDGQDNHNWYEVHPVLKFEEVPH